MNNHATDDEMKPAASETPSEVDPVENFPAFARQQIAAVKTISEEMENCKEDQAKYFDLEKKRNDMLNFYLKMYRIADDALSKRLQLLEERARDDSQRPDGDDANDEGYDLIDLLRAVVDIDSQDEVVVAMYDDITTVAQFIEFARAHPTLVDEELLPNNFNLDNASDIVLDRRGVVNTPEVGGCWNVEGGLYSWTLSSSDDTDSESSDSYASDSDYESMNRQGSFLDYI